MADGFLAGKMANWVIKIGGQAGIAGKLRKFSRKYIAGSKFAGIFGRGPQNPNTGFQRQISIEHWANPLNCLTEQVDGGRL
jgi:hypothetical protein